MVHIIFHYYEVSYEAAQNKLYRLRNMDPYIKFAFLDADTQANAD